MPIAASLTGTLTRVAAGGTAATGTLSVIGYSTGAATGTLAVDRTLFLAFYSRVRLNRPDVYVDDELMANLVDTVELDESLDDPIKYATFTLSDKRSAFFDPATLSNGERVVSIDLWSGPPGGVLKWEYAFLGNTETSTNTMPYRPRGAFRAVSLAAKWADVLGCLRLPAMSGLRRGAILAAFAESAGVPIANAGNLGGGLVTKKVDMVGTPFDKIKELGEIEGWFARATEDGAGLEVVSEDTILDGAPIFAFDESNTFDVPESTPDRPVTNWILSTTQVAANSASAIVTTTTSSPGIDSNTIVEITTDHGVEIRRIETQWANVVTLGETLTGAQYQIVSRVTTMSFWTPFMYIGAGGAQIVIPSTQLYYRTTITEQLGGIPASVASGYAWVQGGSFTEPSARLRPVEYLYETYSWNTTNCLPLSTYRARYQYYSPLIDLADPSAELYADGTYRAAAAYVGHTAVAEDFVGFGSDGVGHPTLWRWKADAPGVETYGNYYGNVPQASISFLAAETQPGRGSATLPQVSEEVIMAELDATDASGYTKRTESPGLLPYPENSYELLCIAWRRVIRATSDTLDIPHRAIPFLRAGDHVSVSNHARSLVSADAYVHAIKRTAGVTNGAMRQTTTVKIPQPELVAAFAAFRAEQAA